MTDYEMEKCKILEPSDDEWPFKLSALDGLVTLEFSSWRASDGFATYRDGYGEDVRVFIDPSGYFHACLRVD